MTATWLYRYPLHRMIVRVDDHGVTLRGLGPFHARDRSFVPFDKIKQVLLIADGQTPPWNVLRIDLRHGTGWIRWEFAALTATGTEGRKIAQEIASRAKAAGIVVTAPKERSVYKIAQTDWHFSPPEGVGALSKHPILAPPKDMAP